MWRFDSSIGPLFIQLLPNGQCGSGFVDYPFPSFSRIAVEFDGDAGFPFYELHHSELFQ